MTDSRSTTQAVVIHVSDAPEDVQRAMSTADALRASFPGARIRIIVNGDALSAVPALSTQQVPNDVEVAVCSVGLRRRDIDDADMPAGVEILPAAPVAIVEEQFKGAAYLRL